MAVLTIISDRVGNVETGLPADFTFLRIWPHRKLIV